jgi:DNA-binding NtrC family response regulator
MDKTPVLGVFTCEDVRWDEKVLSLCADFLGWPCHEDELSLRLHRVFGGLGVDPSAVDEAALLEEFVGFNMLGESPAFVESLRLIKKFARCDAPVLIEGETGTGKELAARAIHYLSARRDYPFIPASCGAVPDNLIENELFGHEKGAFTDAKDSQPGLVMEADRGTLFLDEIDTLSAKAQVALLRYLEEQVFKPLGGKSLKRTNTRVVAATNAPLHELAERGLFRKDLLFRLNVLNVRLPPLRERPEDIKLLVEEFTRRCSARYDQPPKALYPDTLAWMQRHDWPGNVRELENIIHRFFLLSDDAPMWIPDPSRTAERRNNVEDRRQDLALEMGFRVAKARAIAQFEKRYLSWLIAETHGNISMAARRAGKERSALGKLLKKHGLAKQSSRDRR